jgi:hypothetical protein
VVVAFASHWLFSLVIAQLSVLAVEVLGLAAVCGLFGSVALLGAAYVHAKVPEARGGRGFEAMVHQQEPLPLAHAGVYVK